MTRPRRGETKPPEKMFEIVPVAPTQADPSSSTIIQSPYSLRSKPRQHPVESLIHTFQFRTGEKDSDSDTLSRTSESERKRLERLEKNRVAAKESRLKKKQQFTQMEQEIERLRAENARLKQEIEQLKRNQGTKEKDAFVEDIAEFFEYPGESYR